MFRFKTFSLYRLQYGIDGKRYIKTQALQTKSQLSMSDIPHPKSFPVIGTKMNFLLTGSGKRLHEYIDNRHKQLGPIFRESIGGNTELVFISDPTLMKTLFLNLEGKYPAHILPEPWILYEKLYGSKRGLFFMEGKEWLDHRRIMNKYLLREDSEKWLCDPIKDTIQSFIEQWKIKATSKSFMTPDIETEFYRLSTQVMVKILVGTKCTLKPTQEHQELLTIFSETVKKIFETTTKLYSLPLNLCQRLNIKVWKDFKECVDKSLYLAHKIVSEILNRRNECDGLVHKLCKEDLSEQMISRIFADFIIAAGDTTAYTSLWILYLLSKNDKIKEEVRTTNNYNINYVVKESMRLYPVAPFLTRIIQKDVILGDFKLNRNTPIIASIYTSGHDESNFSRANEFLPYRWDRNDPRKKELANHVPSASLPFAFGTRSCIGKKIAMLQLTETVKQVFDNFELKCLNKTPVNAITSQVLVPDQKIKLSVSLRQS